MESNDRKEFSALLKATLEVYGSQLSAEAVSIWWVALSRFEIEQVRHALSLHIQSNKFPPRPADVIAAIQSNDGRPGAEEAWASMPRDEATTVVWTEEMAQAWGVALPLLEQGDQVAARMAFSERYRTLVQQARSRLEPARWTVSLGTDQGGRERPLLEAVERGRLPYAHVAALLPYREDVGKNVLAMIKQKALTK